MSDDIIRIQGIVEFQKQLRHIDKDLPKQIRVTLNEATTLVIDWARPRMPSISGRARKSLKAKSSQREARASLGGRLAAYVPWLDFGGEGKKKGRPAWRTFIKKGRYLYAGLDATRDEVTEVMDRGLRQLAMDAGLELDG